MPYWSRCGKSRREWGRLFNVRTMVRVFVAASLLCVVIVLLFRFAFPGIQLADLKWLAVKLPCLFLFLYGMSWLYRIIPEKVSLFEDCILIQHGDNARRIDRSNILSARIVVYAENTIRLRIWYRSAEDRKSLTLGLGSQVQLQAVQEALGMPLHVFDARSRSVAIQAGDSAASQR